MSGFLMCLVEFLGGWAWGSFLGRRKYIRWEAELKTRTRALLEDRGKLEERLEAEKQSTRSVDALVVEDAIRREARAKAALRAVLKQDGCSEAEIAMVMSNVDNVKDGDLQE